MIGTALLFVGELGSIAVRDARVEDASVAIVGTFFRVGILLSAAGFLSVAGKAALRAGVWHGWRQYTLLVTGIWTTGLLGLNFTKALPTAVGIYGLCLLALCYALYTQPEPLAARPEAQLQRT